MGIAGAFNIFFGWKKLGKSTFMAALCAVLVFFCAEFKIAAQQNNEKTENSQGVEQTLSREDSLPIAKSFGSGEPVLDENGKPLVSEVSSPNTFWIFARMIFFLAVVIALIYGVMWFLKRSQKKKNNDDPFMRVVSSADLAPGKSVQIVTFMNKAFILGVADGSVNLIKEVDGNENEANKEMINAMNLYADKKANVKRPKSFNDILQIFMPGGKRDKNDLFESSMNSTEEFVKRQRERFNGNENDEEI